VAVSFRTGRVAGWWAGAIVPGCRTVGPADDTGIG
jgi:hypothetical protein